MKHTAAITAAYRFAKHVQKFIQNPVVKDNATCREKYWGSSMWLWT